MASLTAQSTITLSSGAKMPVIALGVFQSIAAKQSTLTAFHHGYRHVDSARYYANEEEVGAALKESGLKREDVWLTTKVFSGEHGSKETPAAIRSSNERLGKGLGVGTAPWDLILLHDPMAGRTKRLEAWKALIEAKKARQVKSIGVSNFGVKHLEELKSAGLETPDINQIELHPWCQQKPIVEYCKKESIVVQAYCPLLRGKKQDDPTLLAVAKDAGKTPAQVLVRWSLQSGFVPLPKSDTPSRIAENVDVFGWELSADQMKTLNALDKGDAGAISWNPIHSQ